MSALANLAAIESAIVAAAVVVVVVMAVVAVAALEWMKVEMMVVAVAGGGGGGGGGCGGDRIDRPRHNNKIKKNMNTPEDITFCHWNPNGVVNKEPILKRFLAENSRCSGIEF